MTTTGACMMGNVDSFDGVNGPVRDDPGVQVAPRNSSSSGRRAMLRGGEAKIKAVPRAGVDEGEGEKGR